MFCKNCGKEIDEKALICPHCGVAVVEYPLTRPSGVDDNGGFLWGLLGCCIPIVGLILFLVWKDTKPKTSKAAGIGAIVCVGCVIAFYVFVFIIAIISSRGYASPTYYY